MFYYKNKTEETSQSTAVLLKVNTNHIMTSFKQRCWMIINDVTWCGDDLWLQNRVCSIKKAKEIWGSPTEEMCSLDRVVITHKQKYRQRQKMATCISWC